MSPDPIEKATIALLAATGGSYFIWPDGTPRDPANQALWRDAMRAALLELRAPTFTMAACAPLVEATDDRGRRWAAINPAEATWRAMMDELIGAKAS